MFSLVEEVDEVGEGAYALGAVELCVVEAACVVHGAGLVNFDEGCLLLVAVVVLVDVLLSRLVPALYQIDVVIHL